jgi:hypothetical protein
MPGQATRERGNDQTDEQQTSIPAERGKLERAVHERRREDGGESGAAASAPSETAGKPARGAVLHQTLSHEQTLTRGIAHTL